MQQSVSGTRDKRNSLLQTMLRKRMPDGGGAFSHSRMSGWRSRDNTSRIALTSICSSIAAASQAASSCFSTGNRPSDDTPANLGINPPVHDISSAKKAQQTEERLVGK